MARTDIRGLEDTLRTLKDIDPVLYRAAQKRLKSDAKPMLAAAKAALPPVALSNWKPPVQDSGSSVPRSGGVSRLPAYDMKRAKRKTILSLKRERVKGTSDRRVLFRLVGKDPAADAYDMGGKVKQSSFSQNMAAKFGKPSRFLWPAAEMHMPGVLRSVVAAKVDMEAIVNEQLRIMGRGKRGRPRGSPHMR